MPFSVDTFNSFVKQHILQYAEYPILDVGPGIGTYADLLQVPMDCIEIYAPYVEQYDLSKKYKNVHIGNVMDFDITKYKYLILGDILEHLSIDDASCLLDRVNKAGIKTIVCVPYDSKQGSWGGNDHEAHLQSDLSEPVMKQRYPSLKKLIGNNEYGIYVNYKVNPKDMKQTRKKISLCLIVKNEEAVLERCINSMKGCYDELIIVDTGSTDRTIEIAKGLGARVEHFKWIDDFAAARNHSFSFATGDWIMWVDADDILLPGDAKRWREIVAGYDHNPNVIGINAPYIYSHESVGTGEIPDFKYHRLRVVRKGAGHWTGRIHEYIVHDGSKTVNVNDVDFHHYRDEGKGTMNTARNLRILKKVVDDCTPREKPRYLFYYAKELTYNNLLDEAIETFLQYIPVSNWVPEKHRAMYELACCYQRKGDISNARKYALEAIHLDENYCDPYVLLGKIAYNEERWKDVIKWMTASLMLDTPKTLFFDFIPYQTYVPWDFISIAHWKLGNIQAGKEAVERCLQYKPKDERYLFNLSQFNNELLRKKMESEISVN